MTIINENNNAYLCFVIFCGEERMACFEACYVSESMWSNPIAFTAEVENRCISLILTEIPGKKFSFRIIRHIREFIRILAQILSKLDEEWNWFHSRQEI